MAHAARLTLDLTLCIFCGPMSVEPSFPTEAEGLSPSLYQKVETASSGDWAEETSGAGHVAGGAQRGVRPDVFFRRTRTAPLLPTPSSSLNNCLSSCFLRLLCACPCLYCARTSEFNTLSEPAGNRSVQASGPSSNFRRRRAMPPHGPSSA